MLPCVIYLAILALTLTLTPSTRAQLTPSPTYTPPPASQGTVASTSSPNSQWADVLGNTLWFFDAQRSGHLDEGTYGNRVEWRNDSALEDGSDWGTDLVGGWYDAGDYIKATFPLGYTMYALAWGALTAGQGYELANQTAYLDGTLRWGFDWLIKAHPSDGTLYVQVGDTAVDNDYWQVASGGDQDIPDPRPAYPINDTFPGTDALASTAAAFAIGAILYSGASINTSTSFTSAPLSNTTYAATLLDHAERAYGAAKNTTPWTTFSESVPAAGDAYSSSGFGDDLCVAALTLALATNQSQYYADAYAYYQNFSLTGSQKVWNWDSRGPVAYVMFVQAALARPQLATAAGLSVNLTGWQAEAEQYFDAIVNEDLRKGYITKGGLLYYKGDSDSNSLQPAMAATALLLTYAPLASTSDKTSSYQSFAQSQIDYLMGDNPMSVPYIVGMHPNSPQNPHSALASGGDNINNIRDDPPTEAHVMYGLVVGGPLSNDKFWDYRDDYVQSEGALDYNAVLPGIAAMMLVNGSSDPFYVSVQAGTYSVPSGEPCDAALPCSSGLSGGAIAGIVVGVVLGLLAVLVAVGWWKREAIRRWWRKGYMGPR